jgi:predicted permease
MTDFRYALRGLRKSPVSSAVIVVLLALGICANTVIFSLVNALLLRPLPVQRPQELVQLLEVRAITFAEFSPGFCKLLREHPPEALSEVGCEGELDVAVSEGGNIERAYVGVVSPNYFSLLGVGALYGHVPTRADEAILSYHRFHGDLAVLGKTVLIAGHPFTVAGALPRGFNGIQADTGPDVFITEDGEQPLELGEYVALPFALGRLRPGATLAQAGAQLTAMEQTASADPRNPTVSTDRIEAVRIPSGASMLRDRFSGAVTALMAGALLLLLIVCANVAGLLLARAAARSRETAVRIAVGATRWRLIRQIGAECGALVLAGGVLGLALAYSAIPLVLRVMPPLRNKGATSLPLRLDVSLDFRVLAFTLAACAATALLFALAPAISAGRADVNEALKSIRSSMHIARSRSLLVAVQVSLCTLLLLGAGLMVRTLHQLRTLDAGFDRKHVVTFSIDPEMVKYTEEQGRSIESRLLEQVRVLPGVASASYAFKGLMRGTGQKTTVAPAGQPARLGDGLNTSINGGTLDYFETMGMRIVEGRGFTNQERTTPPIPAIVNQAFVRRFFPNQDPIGKRFGGSFAGKAAEPNDEIIGVVADAKYRSLREDMTPTFYSAGPPTGRATNLQVRTAGDPKGIISAAQGVLRSLDSRLPFYEIHTLEEEVDASLWQETLLAWLSSVFAAAAAALAGVGLYGMLAYAVTQRKREIGIRMALGAEPGNIARLVSWQALWPVAAGIAVGTAAFAATARWIASLLYGVHAADPVTIFASVAFVALVATMAVSVPAWQAIRVDPSQVLRDQA